MNLVLLGQWSKFHSEPRAFGTAYAAVLNYAFDPGTTGLHSFLSAERRWPDERGCFELLSIATAKIPTTT